MSLNVRRFAALALPLLLGLISSAANAAPCSVPSAPHPSLTAAVADAACNPILLAPGTYAEQLRIGRSVVIRGTGPGANITAPPALPILAGFGTAAPIIAIEAGATVTLNTLNVTGPIPAGSACASTVYGIFAVAGSTANLDRVMVTGIRDVPPFDGCQSGIAIRAGSTALGPAQLNMARSTAAGYQKGGVVVDGNGSTALITDSIVRGIGATPVIAQVGIQSSQGAVVTLRRTTVEDHLCNNVTCGPNDTNAMGVLAFSGNVLLEDSTVRNNDMGVYFSEALSGIVRRTRLQNNRYWGAFNYGSNAEFDTVTVSGSLTGVASMNFVGDLRPSATLIYSSTVIGNQTGLALYDDAAPDGITPTLSGVRNHIAGNTVAGVDVQGPGAIAVLTCSFWGSATGPIHPTNPGGTGDLAVGAVTFTPFSAVAPPSCGNTAVGVPTLSPVALAALVILLSGATVVFRRR